MRCCIRSALRSIVSSIVRRCSSEGSDAGSSNSPVSVRITVIGVRSSWAMIDRKSVRIRSRSFNGTAASVQLPCWTRRRPRLERTYSRTGRPPRDADETERFQLRQQALHDAGPYVGAVLGKPALEIRGRRAALHECERGDGQRRTARAGRCHVAEHTTRYSTESTVTTRRPAGAMTSTLSPGSQPRTADPSGESAEIQPCAGSPSPGNTSV